MTSPFDVPEVGTEAYAAWRWLTSADCDRARATIPELHDRRWVEIEALSSFWDEEGAGAASSAMAGVLAAAGKSGADLVLSAVRKGAQLRLLLGLRDNTGSGQTDEQAQAVREIVTAQFPGARLSEPEQRLSVSLLTHAWALPGRTCLFGVPKAGRYPPAVPILERLAGSGVTHWSLNLHAFPVDSGSMLSRYAAIGGLRREFAAELATSRRMNATETVQGVDPLLAELESVLGQEQKRAGSAAVHGCLYGHMWVSAPTQPAAEALAAVAVASAAPTNMTPFPLRSIPYDRGSSLDPGVPLSSAEVATLFTPPLHDVPGLQVASWSRFDANPEAVEGSVLGSSDILLGRTAAGIAAEYPRDLLTRHACVTGMTGSGKSAFIRALLGQLSEVPYLVIEPTKTEYADQVESAGGTVWRIGDPAATMRLNPCEVPPGVPLSLHIDLLLGLLRSTFGLMPPLPFLLEMGLRRAYHSFGWDPATGHNVYGPPSGDFVSFPTLSDVLAECLELVNELGYSGEVRNNVTGALRARLGSLTVGPKGLAFDTDEVFDEARLLSGPAVVNLDLVGNDEEKAFGVGLVLIRLLEARRGQRSHALRHLTIVEEAHRVFRRTDRPAGEGEPGNDFASETLSNLLSEVRSAGEGIVVIDQSPRRLADAALANTALKVAFRSTFGDDLDRLQSSLNLDQQQRQALVGMPTFNAVVFWEGMDRPVRIKALATHLVEVLPPQGPRRPRSALSDPDLSRLARAWVAAGDAGRIVVDTALQAQVTRLLPASLPEVAAREVSDMTILQEKRRAISQVARTRSMPRSERSRLRDADPSTVRAGALNDGSAPFRGCPAVCPEGGCPAREVAAEAAQTLRTRGAGDRIQPGREAELCNLINGALFAQYGAEVGPALPAVTAACAAVQALSGTSGEYLLPRVLGALNPEANERGERP